jgi:hypothetical protein
MDKHWNESIRRMVEEDLTQDQLESLGSMARLCQAHTGKLPTTVEQITEHWYDLQEWAFYEADKRNDSIAIECLVGLDHMGECIWLARLEKRSDAPALLAQALALTMPFPRPHRLPEAFFRFRSLYRPPCRPTGAYGKPYPRRHLKTQ